jgi:hypothetical protein
MRKLEASPVAMCSQCQAHPGLVVIEANGVDGGRAILCARCVAKHVEEQRARRVTPMAGVPLGPPLRRSRPLAPRG